MTNMFSDDRKKLKTHTHTRVYTYTKKEKEVREILKPQNSPRYTLTNTKKLLMKPKPLQLQHTHTHTHTTINIKYQRQIKQTKVTTFQERGTMTPNKAA